mmetsp:Transcript_27340/g.48342  ORF Transcript_27340/g.48342 Transcript_27340/m.48342 type:complete len:120 (-) Transcript_27340:117-476(-)|eukprot:CAMPEP_0197525048 /NCGR_PEP_ID=MMETSP1318-20131121/10588_1 /TAXON_ID=552666 /ORGANISM="Partenskyella glossopodia, Strain RCC365" /LENGTH=119 /DNA_ID=CAMNT_0043078205 /DNA_START=102 /DNA_END=461 /DNA_ORIENTATION=-
MGCGLLKSSLSEVDDDENLGKQNQEQNGSFLDGHESSHVDQEYHVIVLYDYEKQSGEQLSVHEGEVVRIRNENTDGWLLAVKGEEQGWIPATWVRRVKAEDHHITSEYVDSTHEVGHVD